MYSTSVKWKENIYKNTQCAMNIYIDNVLINPDYIFDFRKGGNVFDAEELELGSTPSQYIELKLYKDRIPNSPKTVRVEYGILINNALTVEEVNEMLVGTLNGIPVRSLSANDSSFEMIPIGIYNIDDYTDNDDGTITIKALDNMIKFEFNYDGSQLIPSGGSATLLQVAQDICNKAGVELGSTSFLNSNKRVAVYDNTVSARKYISYIAESAGCFAFIGRDGKLYFRSIYEDEVEVPLELFAEYKWSEEYKISKVSYEDGLRSFKFGNDTRNNLWINQENMYIVDEDQIERIYNKVNELTVNSFEGKTVIDPAIDIGDKIVIDGKPVIYQGEMTLEGRFIAQISSKVQIKQKEETVVKTPSQKNINRRVESRIDQVDGKIETLASEVSEDYYTKTQTESKIEQKAESIASTVSQTYSTKAETATAKNEAISSANSSTDTKLQNYSTTTQMNSAINQKANEITSTVSETYSTKTETNTAKSEAISSANSATDTKLQNYSTTTQMNSAINQKANEITSSVSETYSTKTETANAVNNIEVGGRNYIEGTSSEWVSVVLIDKANVTLYPCSVTDLTTKGLQAGDTLRVSFYVKFSNDITATGTGTKTSHIQGNRNNGGSWQSITITGGNMKARLEEIIASESKEGYVNTYITLPANFNDGTYSEKWQIGFRFDYYTGTFYVKNMMVCKGDKYLDWTPAPEDIENELQTNYSTTTQMNSAINQKADSITSSVSATYETKSNASSTYATKAQLNTAKSEIKQTTDSITSTVSTKVGNNEIISRINQSSEAVTINANKISLSGKTINLTSDNTTIASTNFNVDKNGKLNCSDANITGGNITLSASGNNVSKIKVENSNGTVFTEIMPAGVKSTSNGVAFFQINPALTAIRGATSSRGVLIADNNFYVESDSGTGSSNAKIHLEGSTGKITCTSVSQTSLANQKKNFEKLNDALAILNKIDIYRYNYKSEDDTAKKHIGFVIGENYKYREEVTSNENNGVDLYSFVSLCCKAIQEQQEEISELKQEINTLKNKEV